MKKYDAEQTIKHPTFYEKNKKIKMKFLICLSNSGKIHETQIKVVICWWSNGEVQFE